MQETSRSARAEIPPPELLDPLGDRVLVRLDDEFQAGMSSGEHGAQIIVPEEQRERRPAVGTVVRAGPDCTLLKPGDRVLTIQFAGIDVPLPGPRSDEEGWWCVYHEIECLGAWVTPAAQAEAGRAHEAARGAPAAT